MKTTPCQDSPEAWVGDDYDLRKSAANECLSCWRFLDCDKEAKADPPEFGVMAGRDFTPSRRVGRPRVDAGPPFRICATCSKRFVRGDLNPKDWLRRKFCSLPCVYARNGAA